MNFMQNLFRICVFPLVLSVMGVNAQSVGHHYVYFSDGRVSAYPFELVKSLEKDAEGCTLILQNDSVLSWRVGQLDSVSTVPPDFPKLVSLMFGEELNDELTDDVEAVIAEGRATATVPAIGKYLTPTFVTDRAEAVVYVVDGAVQTSGLSRLRFADEVTYTVSLPGYQRLAAIKTQDEVWSTPGPVTEQITLTKEMLSTNAPTSRDAEGLEMMLDGDVSTMFHSTWSNDGTYEVDLSKQVYVQVDLDKAVSEWQFHYVSRTGTDRYNIKEWKIEASDNGSQWVEVTVLNESNGLPVTGQGVNYTSPVIKMDKAYSHLRFTAVKVGYKNYLCLSEFALYEVTDTVVEAELLHPATYAYRMMPMGRDVTVVIDWPTDRARSVPRIDIDIEGGATVTSKDYYLNALITIQGCGIWPDFQDSVQIKGRGNTSWNSDKKPYRLKFGQSVKPFGWKKGKNWNLIAQSQAGSLLSNPVAMKIARMVDTAAANDVMPVELYMNGKYRGSYIFTQKTGLANNSVDLDDESQAVMLELDTYYDEVYKFKSSVYNLPVNVKEPDFSEGETSLTLSQVQSDFSRFERGIANKRKFERMVDLDKLVRFMLVNELVLNTELCHPKSIFLYRSNLHHLGSRYTFGPVWDFDWSYGYEGSRKYCTTGATKSLFSYHTSDTGNKFFSALWKSTPWIRCLYYRLWVEFMDRHLQEVLDYVDDYYAFANSSFQHNASMWSDGNGYADIAARMKSWLAQRANYLMASQTVYDEEEGIPYTFGDVNNDGRLNETDLQEMLSQLMSEADQAVSSSAQEDMDADGRLSVSDIAWMCSQMNPLSDDEISEMTDWSGWKMNAVENSDPLSLEVQETDEGWRLTVQLDNKLPYIACMMDLALPAGFTVADGQTVILPAERVEESHTWIGNAVGADTYRILGYSQMSLPVADKSGSLFSLPLQADASLAAGDYTLQAENIRFVLTNGQEKAFNDVQVTFSVLADGISATVTESGADSLWPADVYDIQGRLVRRQAHSLQGLDKGIYIVKNRKVMIGE